MFVRAISILLLLFCLGPVSIGAQQQNSGQSDIKTSDIFADDDNPYTQSLKKIVMDLQQTIQTRLNDLAKKHQQLVMLRPQYKDQQTIITEDVPYTYSEGYESNLLKYISFKFDTAGNVQQVKLASEKKRLHYEFMFENKAMVFNPPNVQNTQIILERFDNTEKTALSEISLDNQIKALRLLEASLRSSIYRMDIMIALYKDKKDRKNEYQIDI